MSAAAMPSPVSAGSFGDDVSFLKAHMPVIVLSDRAGRAKAVVAPALQGRVMTSTAEGDAGRSFGWINRELISSHSVQPHINVYGGEDRFWMGPEGGQYSIFFAKDVPFDLAHWFTPAPLDIEPFAIGQEAGDRATFHRAFALTNYSGVRFDVAVERTVQLLSAPEAWKQLGSGPGRGLELVAFESLNRVRNAGEKAWQKDTGLLSIWILGMFNPSPATTIVIPIKTGTDNVLGKTVTSDYFGPVPPDRLVVKDGVVFFRGDGKFRSKIGISPRRCKPSLGSYDADNKVLTLVQFSFREGISDYVNSKWEIQKDPYGGDTANSYNDGPAAPGSKPLGPFYELESSSPAAALAPGASLEHVHRTFHVTGPEAELDRLARATLGVGLKAIAGAFVAP